jgi:hypothetical protein
MIVNRDTWPLEETGRGCYQVHVHVEKLVCWYRNGVERSCRLLVDLPLLALLAVSAHVCHVLALPFPHKMCSHHAFGCTYARVATLLMAWKTAALTTSGTSGLVCLPPHWLPRQRGKYPMCIPSHRTAAWTGVSFRSQTAAQRQR